MRFTMFVRCFCTRLHKTKVLQFVESSKLRIVPVLLNYPEKVICFDKVHG